MPFDFDPDISTIIAALRGSVHDIGPAPVIPQQVFLACDGCGASMRSETAFLCRRCIRAHGVTSPEGVRLMARGMAHIDAMRDAASEARCTGRWN